MTGNIFLLFDYIHLVKSLRNNWVILRNNWVTEKMQELTYLDNAFIKVAKWNDGIILKEKVSPNFQNEMLQWLLNLSNGFNLFKSFRDLRLVA